MYAVHTEYSTKIQIGTQQVMFKSRGLNDIDKIEIPFSLKYAMRHDELFLTKMLEKRYTHARASDFKSIQAAGGLAATEGKVIAIDNVSGHYQPGWKLLKQAVDKINTNFAFADNALVGLLDKERPVFFPLKTFLFFAEFNFDRSKFNLRTKTENPQLPTNINGTSKKHFEDGYWTKKRQKELETSLDYFMKNPT